MDLYENLNKNAKIILVIDQINTLARYFRVFLGLKQNF